MSNQTDNTTDLKRVAALNPAPRWRGFNLPYFFTMRSNCVPVEQDFAWIAEWGFDYVRLPLCYTLWTADGDRIIEAVIEKLDRAIELAGQYKLHMNLAMHRAPGYSVNPERTEPFDLWKDAAALDAFCAQWRMLARRYAAVGDDALSINLVNEPPSPSPDGMTRDDHARVMRAGVAAVREVSPGRTIVVDGLSWGNDPAPELADLGGVQSCRGYLPIGISHFKAPWMKGSDAYPTPSWPGGYHVNGPAWDRSRLDAHHDQWASLFDWGVGVHCGECGAHNRTPHDVFLNWFRDVLESLAERGIGYALWNFRGSFGVIDSRRDDVAYEDWHGHALDRRLLDLIRSI